MQLTQVSSERLEMPHRCQDASYPRHLLPPFVLEQPGRPVPLYRHFPGRTCLFDGHAPCIVISAFANLIERQRPSDKTSDLGLTNLFASYHRHQARLCQPSSLPRTHALTPCTP